MVISPFLTVSAQPAFEIGRRGVDLLLDRLSDPDRPFQEIVLPTELVIRESSGAPISEASSASAQGGGVVARGSALRQPAPRARP